MKHDKSTDNLTIVLYDGVCHLCDACVQFVLTKEKDAESEKRIHFCQLQSEKAQQLLAPFDENIELNTVYLIEDGKLYRRSTAVLHIARYLRSPWSWGRVCIVIPGGIRDWCYDAIGKRRYRWFGRDDTCILPNNLVSSRLLDD